MEGYQWELGNQKRGIPHNTEVAEEAIVLLKRDEEIEMNDIEYISVKANDLGNGEWQNIFIVFGYFIAVLASGTIPNSSGTKICSRLAVSDLKIIKHGPFLNIHDAS